MKKKSKAKSGPAPKASGVSVICWFLAGAAALIGVFWFPWHVGFSAPVEGESYAFGFNNKVGILVLGLSILLGIVACWLSPRPDALKWINPTARIFPPFREAKFEYLLLVGFSLVLGVFILFWSSYLVDPAWCEARGFIYGMDLLALGQVPYRDFMFNYGPATIYLPFWLSNLTGGALSFEQAYALFLVLFTAAGFTAIFALLRKLAIPTAARPWILLLALSVWFCTSMGLQYTPVRFVIVPAALLFLDWVACLQTSSSIGALLRVGLASAAAVAVCLAISPEMGIAVTVAVGAYSLVLFLRRSIPQAAAALLGAFFIGALTLFVYRGYLDSVFAFGSGGGNFPIFPNITNLAIVAISVLALPPLIAAAVRYSSEQAAPLAIALAVGGGLLLPAAMGRCDPGHVAINAMVPIFLMFPAAAAAGRIAFRSWIVVYAAVWVVLIQYIYWTQYIPNFESAIQMHNFYEAHPDQVSKWKSEWADALRASPFGPRLHWSKTLVYPQGLDQLTSKGRVLLTNSNEGNLWLARFLLLQKSPPREYFHAYSQGASTPSQIATKLSQDSAYDFLIVPESTLAMAGRTIDLGAYQQGADAMLSRLLLFPVDSVARNQPYLPDSQFAAQLLSGFKALGRFNGYIILQRN